MVNLEDWVGQEVREAEIERDRAVVEALRERRRYESRKALNAIAALNQECDDYGDDYGETTRERHLDCLPALWEPPNDIIKIQPMNKKEQLKQQIKALEAELKNLEEAEKVPEGFNEERAYKFLNGYKEDGLAAIDWGDNTKEGREYWIEISVRNKKPSDKDVIQLQKWIIESYRRKLGLGS